MLLLDGRAEPIPGNSILEFHANGTTTASGEGQSLTSSYEFIDSNHIRLTDFPEKGSTEIFEVSVPDNKLVLKLRDKKEGRGWSALVYEKAQ